MFHGKKIWPPFFQFLLHITGHCTSFSKKIVKFLTPPQISFYGNSITAGRISNPLRSEPNYIQKGPYSIVIQDYAYLLPVFPKLGEQQVAITRDVNNRLHGPPSFCSSTSLFFSHRLPQDIWMSTMLFFFLGMKSSLPPQIILTVSISSLIRPTLLVRVLSWSVHGFHIFCRRFRLVIHVTMRVSPGSKSFFFFLS